MPIVKMPADETIKEKFSEYVAALGKVAHSWNFLQERLGQLFVRAIPTAPHKVLLAVWYSEQNDRAQRRMLRAAINSGAIDSWPSKLPTNAKDDILRLLEEADKLGLKRDQAIHTPCAIMTNTQGTEMIAAFYNRNPLAEKLKGKKLLDEFEAALHRHTSSWPNKRPSLSRELHRQSRQDD